MNSDGELELVNSSSSSSSPGDLHHDLPNVEQQQGTIIKDRSSAASAFDMNANLDASIRRRAVHRMSNSSGKRFSMGSDDDNDDEYGSSARKEERDQTPTLSSTISAPPNLTRSNSLGLGFGHTDSTQYKDNSSSNSSLQNPPMYIASSSSSSLDGNAQRITSADDLVKISPAHSTASSSNMEEDDAIFKEAKEIK